MNHNNADALSRRPCLSVHCRHCERLEIKEELQRKEESGESFDKCFSCSLAGYACEDGAGSSTWSREELQAAQEHDRDLKPVMKESETRPPWQTVAPYNGIIKAYWSQLDGMVERFNRTLSNNGLNNIICGNSLFCENRNNIILSV